jgi:HlyD family secretion protein
MKSVLKKLSLPVLIISITSCGNGNGKYDASGTFEAEETIVSAEATGKILQFNVEEGATLVKDSVVGKIDPTAIELQKEQASSSVEALQQKTNDASPQVNVLESQIALQTKQIAVDEEQLKVLQKEQQRFQKLVAADAVPAKQLDDINGQVNVLKEKIVAGNTQLKVLQSQINAQRNIVAIQNRGILSEKNPMEKRVAQIQDQLNKTVIKNPVAGTVLTKYAQPNEFTATGKALYKIADLSIMKLRAYITGDQLAQVKLGQQVKVKMDDGKGKYRELPTSAGYRIKQSSLPKQFRQKKKEPTLSMP